MGRPVQMRASYNADAGFLLRLGAALNKDTRQSAEWRKQAGGMAADLARFLLDADSRAREKTTQKK